MANTTYMKKQLEEVPVMVPKPCPVSILNRKLICFFAGSLIPFEEIESNHFRILMSGYAVGEHQQPLCYSTLLNEGIRLAQYHLEKFIDEIAREKYSLTLVLHNFRTDELLPTYTFVSVHWIDKCFKLRYIPIGLSVFDGGFASYLKSILDRLTGRIFFVTSNFTPNTSLWVTISSLFDPAMGDPSLKSSWLFCLPSFIAHLVVDLISGNPIETHADVRHIIPRCVSRWMGDSYTDLLSSDFSEVVVDSKNDAEGNLLARLTDLVTLTEECYTLEFLESLHLYWDQLWVRGSEYDQVTFAVKFFGIFQDVISSACSMANPTAHMVLKWIKILIHHTRDNKWEQFLDKGKLDHMRKQLQTYHDELELKSGVLTCSYLHPSTRKFLTEAQIIEARNQLNALLSDAEKSSEDDFEEKILREFSCSGSISNELYTYETMSSHKIQYTKGKPFLSKECGPALCKFWEGNSTNQPELSKLSQQFLAVQTCSDKGYKTFKQSFRQLKGSSQYLCEVSADLQLYNFLYYLVNMHDVLIDDSDKDTAPSLVTKRRKSNQTSEKAW